MLFSAALMVADRIMIRLDNRKMLPKNRTQHSASYCVIERYDRDDLVSSIDRNSASHSSIRDRWAAFLVSCNRKQNRWSS